MLTPWINPLFATCMRHDGVKRPENNVFARRQAYIRESGATSLLCPSVHCFADDERSYLLDLYTVIGPTLRKNNLLVATWRMGL